MFNLGYHEWVNLVKKLLVGCILLLLLSGCESLQTSRVMPQERMFSDLSLEFLDEYTLSESSFKDTTIGGLSALTYDGSQNKFYVLSDDRSKLSPARFYTLDFVINQDESDNIKLDKVAVEKVTFLQDEQGETFARGQLDPEGIALSPQGTVYISSEGHTKWKIAPFLAEFDVETGKIITRLPIPQRYLGDPEDPKGEISRGIQNNLGFESLTIKSSGLSQVDPFRLFTATESALVQDELPPESEELQTRNRFLHYLIQPVASPILVAEHLYLLNPPPTGTIDLGLTELLAIEPEGLFLSLERAYGLYGFNAKIFQVIASDATDTSTTTSLSGNISKIKPMRKQLVLDLGELGIYLDNLEGMTLGPVLPDGTQSLIVISDNNFNEDQVTQFLLFRLRQ